MIGSVPKAERLADENAIRAVLAHYCRGVDRGDAVALKTCFWPEAQVDYGSYKGDAHPFCESLPGALVGYAQTHHQLGQSLIDWDGTSAQVETYVTAGHLPVDVAADEMTYVGRYLDRFEKRGEQWKIDQRTVVMSWTRNGPPSHDADAPAVQGLTVAERKPDDVIYG